MVIDEPRPRCAGCGVPLKRSTYWCSFLDRLPDGKRYPTTLAEALSLVKVGHLVVKLNYARHAVRDDRGHIIDHAAEWHIYGANVWAGGYGTFGRCGKCLPAHKAHLHAAKLKLLAVPEPVPPVERFSWAGATARYLSGVGGWVRGVLDRARFRTAAATAVRDALVGEVKPETRLDAEFLYGPFFDVRDDELVEIWRALAARRFDFIGMYEEDAGNRLARERSDRLRGCMLKVRSAAQARGVSVDFEVPELLKFDGDDWHDLGEM